MTRVLVCGSRGPLSKETVELVRDTLSGIRHARSFSALIHGYATGVDAQAAKWAKAAGIKTIGYMADWSRHGKAAGPIRNQRMIDTGKPDLVVAFRGGRGTADMVRRAKIAGIELLLPEER